MKQFWIIAARTSQSYLTRDEFYLALRLIAYAQNGMPADEKALMMGLDVALPRFESDFAAKPDQPIA